MGNKRRRSSGHVLLPLLAAVLLLASCSDSPAIRSHASLDTTPEPVELTVWLWPGTGYESFIEQFDEANPGISIELVRFDHQDLHDNLQTAFAAGYGAPDISIIDLSYIERFKRFPAYFHNLADLTDENLAERYLDWKWKQAASADGSFVFGMPMDIGPMVMAYRISLYGTGGLPIERKALAQTTSDWDKFFEAGAQLTKRTGKPMIDNISTLYRVILGQADVQYFDATTGEFIGDGNPAVRRAWDYAVRAKEEGLSAGLNQPTTEWARGLEQGHFATLLAPSWMLSYVTENAPGANRQWTITSMPEGSGNWGGSFMTIPRESEHPQEAYALIRWMSDEAQQLEMFRLNNTFPALYELYDRPEINNKRDGFFMGAPVGELLSDAAMRVRPVYEGPYQYLVNDRIEIALMNVEEGLQTGDQAWDEAMADIKRVLAEKQLPQRKGER